VQLIPGFLSFIFIFLVKDTNAPEFKFMTVY